MEIGVSVKEGVSDPRANALLKTMRTWFSAPVDHLSIVRVYSVPKPLSKEQLGRLADSVLADPVSETGFAMKEIPLSYDWAIEVKLKQGLTDNAGATAKTVIEESLGLAFAEHEQVRSSTMYLFKGAVQQDLLRRIANELLANELIEEIQINRGNIDVACNDEELLSLSKRRQLALNLEEMRAIKAFFESGEARALRSAHNMPPGPTDVELEAIAQTWSEHCKHKIFNAKIRYEGTTIDSLYKTYVKKATDESLSWLISVFSDNAGIIALNDKWHLAIKVETHNSPSALDPYGGALTGILGVNRDILGAGKGARLIANMDVFCFAPPDYALPLPPRLLHPKRIFEGVRRGVEHGGNKSGVPTVNGAIVFDERFLGKPLVYCGSIGMMDASDAKDPKRIEPNDLIVIAGGRTGKDGIHGATFSSEELHEKSPTGAVQLGDPYTQKKLHDFLLDAKKENLFRAITDNGAGGFSSSIGEMAQFSGGCEIHLEKAPLKYPGLHPWEILVSESQERMTLAVDPRHVARLQEIARLHEVEISTIGAFTQTGLFHVLYEGRSAALLPLSFLHHGVPQMNLEAKWNPPVELPFRIESSDLGADLHRLLSRYNICSKESVVRQYDHEVQGASALKPLVGAAHDGPGDAAILRPLELFDSKEGIVVSNGLCPRYSDFDAYWMSASAIDEAIRNQICVGADPSRIAILDNFCWPDPINDPHLLAQLVRSCQALYAFATAFGVPIVSGKDSMKNNYRIGNQQIAIPPTLLITAVGKINNVLQAVSMDLKRAGDLIYLVGQTRNELGGSEYAAMKGCSGGIVPKVDAASALASFRGIHRAIERELIASCHDCSDGGLAVALAESAFAGGLGMKIDLPEGLAVEEMLFSETPSRFVITIDPKDAGPFEETMDGCAVYRLGRVTEEPWLCIGRRLKEDIFALESLVAKDTPMIRALVFSGYGINCEREMAFAVERAGGAAEIVHLGLLLEGKIRFGEAKFLLFPGGFSFGDELGAAKALANRLERIKDALWDFTLQGGLILGVCNGFQLLVKLGLLPALQGKPTQSASLVSNDSGQFIGKWVLHRTLPSRSVFTTGLSSILLPIRHGEGKFIVKDPGVLDALFSERQIPFQYADNPNGSVQSIAAVSDPSGRILGMMAHPEAAVLWTQHPEWTRMKEEKRRNKQPFPEFGDGLQLFTNAIRNLEAQ